MAGDVYRSKKYGMPNSVFGNNSSTRIILCTIEKFYYNSFVR